MNTPQQTASHILAEAFTGYTFMKYAFKGKTDAQRKALVHRLFNGSVNAASIYGGVIVTPDNLGALIWLNGKNFPLSLGREIRSGLISTPFKIGPGPTLRLMNHEAELEKWVKQHAAPNMGYLWCIGVAAEARGKGISRLLINQCLTDMRKANLTECWLTTEDPTNVAIYQKQGFTIERHITVPSSQLRTWTMRKIITS